MMNDELNKQLEHLKQENMKLKAELEVFKLTQSTKMSIEQYYIAKYVEGYNDTLTFRVADILKDIKILQEEYNHLEVEVASVADIVALNDMYKLEIKKLEATKRENETIIEQLQNEYDIIHKELLEKQETLKNATLGYYKTILKSMDAGSDLVMTNVAFVMEQLSEQLYLLILECRALSYQDEILFNKLENTNQHINKSNKELEQRTLDLLNKIKTRTNEEIGTMQATIKEEIAQREALKKELVDTFETIKKADLKVIIDKLNFYKITETSNAKIAEHLEELIDKCLEKLKSQETFKNLKTIKEMRLADLLKEKSVLDNHKQKFNQLKIKENDYYLAYVEASKHYDTLVDFLDEATLVISENAYYYETSKKYLNLKQEEKEISDQYNILVSNINKLEKDRQNKTLASFSDDEVKVLSLKLSELNSEKNRLSTSLRDVRDGIRLLEQNHKNIQLITVLREKEFVEAKINMLYNNLRTLKVKVNKVKEEIKDLEIILKDYDKICNEIKGLEDEINN